jgi:hydroxymethylbilane synthase
LSLRRLVIGSRSSALARRQVELALDALRKARPELETETAVVQTEGDRRSEASLEVIGGQGVFVKDIERRLQVGAIDLAVHSLKDMPADLAPGLTIGAYLPRGDARDALVGRDGLRLADLPAHSRIGSDSSRRALQVLGLRPDLEMASIRGNVETRIGKLDAGRYDGVVLALAGLERLGLAQRATQVFSIQEMLPAIGQGVLAVECRSDDNEVIELLRGVDHPPTHTASEAERAFLRALGSGCSLPVGAYATVEGGMLLLDAILADESGKPHRAEAKGPASAAERLGTALAQRLRIEARA